MQRAIRAIGLVVLATLVRAPLAQARELSFEQRVAAQRAIEQVYYRHQIGVTKPFDEAVPRAVLEAKVLKVLEQTAALEVYWMTRVTDEMLGRELERMTRETRLPDRLQELFAALRNDPFLIKECLARATLVDRLTRNFYAFDTTLHADARQRVEEIHRQLAAGELDPASDHPNRSVADLVMREPKAGESKGGEQQGALLDKDRFARRELAPDEFRKERVRLPDARGSVAPVAEEREAFVIRVVLSETPSEVRVASYVVPKTSWDLWWETVKVGLRGERVAAVASDQGSMPIARGRASGSGLPCTANDTWTGEAFDGLEARAGHTAVWTGTEMVVWGGYFRDYSYYSTHYLGTGGRYDPATDTWTKSSAVGAPSARSGHSAVWTGSEMVIWGGQFHDVPSDGLNTGGRYNPVTDTWTATSTVGAPSPRSFGQSVVWTGREMVVWGGYGGNKYLDTGGRYDPATDTWTATSTVGAPSARSDHTAVWTGSKMVVWGGYFYEYNYGSPHYLDTGGRYDPVTDSWTESSTVRAPSARISHTAVWTGSEMVVWGGNSYDNYGSILYLDTGGRYDPVTDTWTETSTVGAPSARRRHTAIWTGAEIVVWGGEAYYPSVLYTGGRYDPVTDTWTATSTVGAPSTRHQYSAVWTGTVMVIWGGYDVLGYLDTGGRYDPATDTWTPTSSVGPPSGRTSHTAVWTGSVMVVWGGHFYQHYPGYRNLDTGGRYDPATDTWTATSTVGAPSPRYSGQSAVWTGREMVVWGGYGDFMYLNTGGRYDPAADTWTATSTAGAPSGRWFHTAVWTGREMVVWGGEADLSVFNTGGRYDPATDSWVATSTVGAPSARKGHTAVWTENVMVVWGGQFYDGSVQYLDTGGRYDPATDSWTATSSVGAPSGRDSHTALWTGSVMIVWGGASEGGYLNTGGRYLPATDTWTEMSAVGVPSGRGGHTAVWTGSVAVVWGGANDDGHLNSGGRYDPAKDTWTATSIAGAPSRRSGHTAVWMGSVMVVWGGYDAGLNDTPTTMLNTGGLYVLVESPDNDGDEYTVCDGDCDDANPAVYPGAIEVCNGIDDDCDDQVDEGGGALCEDPDACTSDTCQGPEGCTNLFLDHDEDGTCDAKDYCPSTIQTPTVVIDTCDSGVRNHLFENGCNLGDRIVACQADAKNHGQFVSCIAHLVDAWKKAGLITGQQASRIERCAAQERSAGGSDPATRGGRL